MVWVPNPGRQTDAYLSEADVLFYGGSAGGGKTDLEIGLGLNEHEKSVIFRREGTQHRNIEDRLVQLLGKKHYAASPVKMARIPGGNRTIELGSCKNAGDEEVWQGRPHDLIAFDEVTHFLEKQFIFLRGWLRSTKEGQRCRVVAAGNPPQNDQGAWVINYWRPWLDANHPNPAKPGELRWFWRDPDGESDYEVEPHYSKEVNGVVYRAESRTFIPAGLKDNPYLKDTDYGSTLNMLPEPLRSQLLYGDFNIRVDDRPWQLVPTEWVQAAQARWSKTLVEDCGGMIEQIGADVARGGPDETVLYPRYSNIVFPCLARPGRLTPDGGSVATMIINLMGKQFQAETEPLVTADAIGVGSSVVDHCKGVLARFTPVNVSNKCPYLDRTKKFKFVNMRAYMWWSVREALDPDGPNPLCLPPDAGLLGDLTGIDWKLTPSGIQIDDKDTIKARIGRSPDRGEALALSLMPGAEGGQGMLDWMRALATAEVKRREEAAKEVAPNQTVTKFFLGHGDVTKDPEEGK